MNEQNTDVKSLAHTKWNCKYHVVFAPKYRRKVFFQEKREGIRDIIKNIMSMEGSGNNRRRNMSRSYSFAIKYPAENERFGIYGIFERKK